MNRSLPRRIVAALDRWYLADAPLEPLAACRIALGLTLFGFYALTAPAHDIVWGPEGMVRYAYSPGAVDWRQAWAPLIRACTLVGAAGLALGLATRLSGLVFLFGHLCHTTQTIYYSWGWTLVAPALVIYLLLSQSHRIWSLDALIRRWRRPDSTPRRTASVWPLRLLQINAIAIYIAAAWHRIDDGAWLRGEMVFEAIAASVFTRAPGLDVHLLPYKGALEVLCWYTWLVELAAPFFLWFRRTRVVMALLLMTVHVGLELGAFVGAWQFMMLSVLLTFLPARWLRSLARWPTRLLDRRPSAEPDPA